MLECRLFGYKNVTTSNAGISFTHLGIFLGFCHTGMTNLTNLGTVWHTEVQRTRFHESIRFGTKKLLVNVAIFQYFLPHTDSSVVPA